MFIAAFCRCRDALAAPRRARSLTLVILLVVVLLASSEAYAQKAFFILDRTVLAGSSNQEVVVEANSDIVFLGFSLAVHYDESVLEVKEVTWEGALEDQPAFYEGIVDRGMIGFGCVFDFGPEFDHAIPPGNDIPITRIIFDVRADVDTTTQIVFDDVTIGQNPVKNVITNEMGLSEFVDVVDGTLTIETRTPMISALADNEGFAGDTFTVSGQFFDEPGLAVTVCDKTAAFTQNGDVLTVTAPECDTFGFAPVVVSTERGSAVEPNGFNYLPARPPAISAVSPDAGPAGTAITITGENFLGEGLEVTVCGVAVESTLETDGTITAVVPDCGAAGSVTVEVCTVDGCDAGAFLFEVELGRTLFRRGDAGNRGVVNISSAVFLLNFLFTDLVTSLPCHDAGDIDNNGIVNISDPVNLLNHLFGTAAPPAPPGIMSCGPDPDEPGSAGDLGCDTYDRC